MQSHQQQTHSQQQQAMQQQQQQQQDNSGNRPKRYSTLRQRPTISETSAQQNYPSQHAQHGYFPPQGIRYFHILYRHVKLRVNFVPNLLYIFDYVINVSNIVTYAYTYLAGNSRNVLEPQGKKRKKVYKVSLISNIYLRVSQSFRIVTFYLFEKENNNDMKQKN